MVFMLVILVGLSACKKSQTTTTTTTTTAASLPLKATAYIDSNYPDASIDYVVALTGSNAKYIVTLNTAEELAFTEAGDFLGDGKNFHDGHHGGDTICGDTNHRGGGRHGGGHHGGGHEGGPGHGIPVDSLPAAITAYITANFTGYKINHAELDTLCPNGAVIEVMIGMMGAEPKKAVFDAGNNYLLWAKRIRYADVPQAVKDHITANYGTYQVCNRGELLTMADGSLQYTVYLMLGQTHKFVRLKAGGNLVCEK